MFDVHISCIVVVKNRTDRIRTCLESWYKAKQIKEVVMVDWGSDVPVVEDAYVADHLGDKLKVVRVQGEHHLHRCKALNLSSRYTDGNNKQLLRIDIDYVLQDASWLQQVPCNVKGMMPNVFIATVSAATPDLGGLVLMNKVDFLGYNENMLPMWGHEDTDLIQRTAQSGVRLQSFTSAADYIWHMPHADAWRLVHGDTAALPAADLHNGAWKDVAIAANKCIAKQSPHWTEAAYNILEHKPYYTVVQQVTPDAAGVPAQPAVVISACDHDQIDERDEMPCV